MLGRIQAAAGSLSPGQLINEHGGWAGTRIGNNGIIVPCRFSILERVS
jgi:hypothetical protein